MDLQNFVALAAVFAFAFLGAYIAWKRQQSLIVGYILSGLALGTLAAYWGPLGDALFVAVNSDRSTRRLKGRSRPLVPQDDRMRTLAALECVDFVTLFEEDTPAHMIERVRPDVLAKGADYRRDQIVGAETVSAYGGKVARIPLLAGRSTSALIRRIRRT